MNLDFVSPSSVDAERSILGAILLDNRAFDDIAAMVRSEDFSLDSHRRIYSRMSEMIEAGTAVDIITLSEKFRDQQQLESVGGVSYLASLTDGIPPRANCEHYAGILREKSKLRFLINSFNRGLSRAVISEPADEILQQVQDDLIEVIYRGKFGEGITIYKAANDTMNNLDAQRHATGECIGRTVGIPEWDEVTTGFRDGEFTVFGARPGMGKTALMCQGVRAQVARGERPGIFSLEVDRQQIVMRLACQEAGIPVFETRDPRTMRRDDFVKLKNTIAGIGAGWPIFIDDNPRLTIKDIQAIARLWVAKGCTCIWLDFIQKVRPAGFMSEYDRVTQTVDGLWLLARSVKVPVVGLSQLKRKDDPDSEPTMDDLRSSGEIEQSAHVIGLIYREREMTEAGLKFTGNDKLLMPKQRSGPSSIHVKVKFNGPLGLFEPRYL